jgi:hypothetical protein
MVLAEKSLIFYYGNWGALSEIAKTGKNEALSEVAGSDRG